MCGGWGGGRCRITFAPLFSRHFTTLTICCFIFFSSYKFLLIKRWPKFLMCNFHPIKIIYNLHVHLFSWLCCFSSYVAFKIATCNIKALSGSSNFFLKLGLIMLQPELCTQSLPSAWGNSSLIFFIAFSASAVSLQA